MGTTTRTASADSHPHQPGYASGTSRDDARHVDADAEPWFTDGIGAGLLGALVIAVFFLIADTAERQPFWTPGALGSALFLQRTLAPTAAPAPVLVLGYTAVHGAVFLAAGLMTAFGLSGGTRRLGAAPALALATLIFAGIEVCFLGITSVLAPGLTEVVGAGRVAIANLLAAGSMAALLVQRKNARR